MANRPEDTQAPDARGEAKVRIEGEEAKGGTEGEEAKGRSEGEEARVTTEGEDRIDIGTAVNEAEQGEPGESPGEPLDEDGGEQQEQQEPDLEQALAEANETIVRQQDEVLRVQAEMQNLRRRTEQDVERAHKYALERFAGELLSVMDNLERALEAAAGSDNEQVKALADGVELTRKSFVDALRKFNVEQIDPLGEPFDPQLHQAISLQDNPEVEPNTVTAVMQKGYLLNGRVIRPAMVLVSKG